MTERFVGHIESEQQGSFLVVKYVGRNQEAVEKVLKDKYQAFWEHGESGGWIIDLRTQSLFQLDKDIKMAAVGDVQ